MNAQKFKAIAIQTGELLKYDSTVKEIDLASQSVFPFKVEIFPNDTITSVRAQTIYNAIMTLAKQNMENNTRLDYLRQYLHLLFNGNIDSKILKLFNELDGLPNKNYTLETFLSRQFHAEINEHCKSLYRDGYYFHAVFEAAKTYNKRVKEKSQSDKDGRDLMMQVWNPKGVLKITNCESDTDRNVQEGMAFLTSGLMSAVRNPTAHEPALEWSISENDCLDILSFISFLFRQLDNAVYFKA